MPKFSNRSLEQLKTCHPELIALLKEAILYTDFTILEGFRNEERQNLMVERGLSKVNWPNGKHNTNPSHAVDIAPYPIDWNDHSRFIFLGGFILGLAKARNIKLRWGGDWDKDFNLKDNRFDDLCHFELVT